jgi:hypothetical protein
MLTRGTNPKTTPAHARIRATLLGSRIELRRAAGRVGGVVVDMLEVYHPRLSE